MIVYVSFLEISSFFRGISRSMFQSSALQQLTDTETYQLEALHVNYLGPAYLAVGLWLSSGGTQISISNKYFTWKHGSYCNQDLCCSI